MSFAAYVMFVKSIIRITSITTCDSQASKATWCLLQRSTKAEMIENFVSTCKIGDWWVKKIVFWVLPFWSSSWKVSLVIFLTLFLVQVCSLPAQQKPQPSLLYGFPHRSEVNIFNTKRGFFMFFLPAWNMLQNPWGWTKRSQIQVIEERKTRNVFFWHKVNSNC